MRGVASPRCMKSCRFPENGPSNPARRRLRLLLVKIGGRVRQLLTKVRLHLASGHPGQRLWQALSATGRERAHE